nr:type II secretion system protein [Candidatus Levybacteria bacterium]
MKRYLETLKKNSGFTLIELLVVIGILGVLAAALIATIDPFEQLKKSQDASVKNTVVEFISANIRYYATHNAMPWWAVASGGAGCAVSSLNLTDAAGNCSVSTLIADGELKASFINATNILRNIRFFGLAANTAGVTACYFPQSLSQKKDPNTVYNASGVTLASGGTYWCSN